MEIGEPQVEKTLVPEPNELPQLLPMAKPVPMPHEEPEELEPAEQQEVPA